MKSSEQMPSAYTESGHKKELLDVAEQVEKGVKWNRIPTSEALALLKSFIDEHPEPSPEDDLDECITLMEKIENGVKGGWIPEDEAIKLLKELNDKYPVTE